MRRLPRAPRPPARGPVARADARHLAPRAARGQPLLRRRPDQGRGVRDRIVPAEQDGRAWGHLQPVPRSAHRQAARRGERAVHAVPRPADVRRRPAPLPPRRHRGRALRELPHAVAHVHGGARPPRSPHRGPAPRPGRGAGDARRVQRVPRGPRRRVGGGGDPQPRHGPAARAVRRRGPGPGVDAGARRGARRCGDPRRPAGRS